MRIRFGHIELDDQRFMLERDGVRLAVRPKVFDLLIHLVRYRDRVVLREELVLSLWGTTAIGAGSLSGLVNELRQVLGEAGRGPSSIRTVHARGYQFVAEVESHKTPTVPPQAATMIDGDGPVAEGTNTRWRQPFAPAMSRIRAAFARVPTQGARALLVTGEDGEDRSGVLDEACHALAQNGFETHRLCAGDGSGSRETRLADRLLGRLIEKKGLAVIRAAAPPRARALLEDFSRAGAISLVRPRDPLAACQIDQQIWRGIANLLEALARTGPLAIVVEDVEVSDTVGIGQISAMLGGLGNARVFVLATVGDCARSSSLNLSSQANPRIELLNLASRARERLDQRMASYEIDPLPSVLAEALIAHVREGDLALETIAQWLRDERDQAEKSASRSPDARLERRMRRVEPTAQRRRAGLDRA